MPSLDPFRCSAASRTAEEPLAGTASRVRAFLLLEAPGPWGVEAPRDSRLPDECRAWLTSLERRHSVRPLLVRRPGRPVAGAVRVFAAYAGSALGAQRSWVGTRLVEDVREVCSLDVAGLAAGPLPSFEHHAGTLHLVCTHGRHDACCAERGRPFAAALAQEAPEETWEVSHIGGDRFAANVLTLPGGHYHGRLEPEDAAGFAAATRAGRLDLEHLRGRTAYPFAVQAAEVHLRRHLDEPRVDAVWLLRTTGSGDQRETTAVFGVGDGETGTPGGTWSVRVRTGRSEGRLLTCRAASASRGLSHEVVEVTRS
jgi:hypothetical protein